MLVSIVSELESQPAEDGVLYIQQFSWKSNRARSTADKLDWFL